MNKEILRLAIPNIISNISVPLLSAVDTMLMGHISTLHLLALGLGSMIFVFIYGNFNFLRMGTTGITAQAYGESNERVIINTLARSLLLALCISILLILFKEPIFAIGSYLMNIDESYVDLVKRYYDIRIFAAPALLLQFAIFGWFFGMQNATVPLYITIFINIINIIVSYYLVNALNMGIDGAAYGTLIAQYCGLVLAFIFILRYINISDSLAIFDIFKLGELRKFFSINRNIFIRTVALTFVLAFFYSQSAKHSPQTLAVMVLLLQFLIWFSFAVDGFANATESLVGRYYGAKDWENFYKAIKYNFYWAAGFAILFFVLYLIGGEFILGLYSSDRELVLRASSFMWLVSLLPLVSFVAFIYDGIFIGMTASKALRDAVLLSMILFMMTFYLARDIDYEWALWGSFVLFFIYRGVMQYLMFKKYGRNLK